MCEVLCTIFIYYTEGSFLKQYRFNFKNKVTTTNSLFHWKRAEVFLSTPNPCLSCKSRCRAFTKTRQKQSYRKREVLNLPFSEHSLTMFIRQFPNKFSYVVWILLQHRQQFEWLSQHALFFL